MIALMIALSLLAPVKPSDPCRPAGGAVSQACICRRYYSKMTPAEKRQCNAILKQSTGTRVK